MDGCICIDIVIVIDIDIDTSVCEKERKKVIHWIKREVKHTEGIEGSKDLRKGKSEKVEGLRDICRDSIFDVQSPILLQSPYFAVQQSLKDQASDHESVLYTLLVRQVMS